MPLINFLPLVAGQYFLAQIAEIKIHQTSPEFHFVKVFSIIERGNIIFKS